ncbi:MAG: hypothetical protein AB1668_05305 [Nanoarchaeota archaeon]
MVKRKGSLNLSIEAIVIVVIAFVVLGLGLGFVRSQFGSIQETTTSVQEQIKQQILDDLRTGNKKLSFPLTNINIEKGGSKDIAIGVKNTLPTGELRYKLEMDILEMQEGTITGEDLANQVKFFFDKSETTLAVTEARVHSIRVSAPGVKGNYLVKLKILNVGQGEGTVYDEKTFFVTII